MSDTLPYGYAKLPSSTDHIRLLVIGALDSLHLHPQSLRYSFHTVPVEDAPSFIALSYEWGSPGDTEEIHIDNRPISVRRNLADALKQIGQLESMLRNKSNTAALRLWIDALCIDQGNVKERSDQVLLMKRVYAQASLVLIWLGPEANDSHTIIQGAVSRVHPNFPSPNAHFRSNWYYRNMGEEAATLVFVPPQEEYQRMDRLVQQQQWKDGEEDSELRAAIRRHDRDQTNQTRFENAVLALVSRTYWRRLWVVQEVLLAHSIMFLCGADYISWDALCDYVGFQLGDGDVNLSREPFRKELSGYERDDVKVMASASALEWRMLSTPARELLKQTPGVDLIRAKTWWNPSYAVLHKAIIRWAPRECEDARDKVFGLLGIISNDRDPVARALVPDYSLSAEQLYSTLLESLLRTEEEWLESGQGLFMTSEERSTFGERLARILRVKRGHELVQGARASWNAKFLASRYDKVELVLSSRPMEGLSEVWRATYGKDDDDDQEEEEKRADVEDEEGWFEVARRDEGEDEPIFGEIQLDSPTA